MSCHYPFCLKTFATLLSRCSRRPASCRCTRKLPSRRRFTITPRPRPRRKPKCRSRRRRRLPARLAPTTGANVATVDPSAQKGITGRAIDKVKEVAKSASDIFSRVPCLSPKGVVKSMGSLPHVANKLVSGQPVVIVAFGSSSTDGYGASSPEFKYPNRLAAQLAGNIRPLTSPSSIAARVAKMRRR